MRVETITSADNQKSLKLVCISDTHGMHQNLKIPDGDVLIHAGDITMKGEKYQMLDFDSWLGSLPHKYKIVVCGNHDLCFEDKPQEARQWIKNGIYLQD